MDRSGFGNFTFSLNPAFLVNEGPKNDQPSMQAFQLADPSSAASKPAKRRSRGPNVVQRAPWNQPPLQSASAMPFTPASREVAPFFLNFQHRKHWKRM